MNPSLLIRFPNLRWLFGCGLVLLAVAPLAGQDNDPAWRWKFAPEQSFLVVAQQHQTSLTQVDSRETTIDAKTTVEMEWRVEKVEADGIAHLRQRITRVAVDIGNPAIPAQALQLDTAQEEPKSKTSRTLYRQLKPLLELPMEVVIEPNGKIVEVTLPDDVEARLQELPGAMSIRRLLSPAGLQQLLSQLAVPMPDEPSASGSWETTQTLETPFGQLQQQTTYEPQSSADGEPDATGTDPQLSMIKIRSSTTPVGEPASGPSRLVSMSGEGWLKFDVQRGFSTGGELTNQVVTEREYREKTIQTRVDNTVTLSITPQS